MKKNKKNPDKEKELSAKRECPTALGKIIFDANLIPENVFLRSYKEIFWENNSYPPDGSTQEILNFLLEQKIYIFNECFVNFSESYKEMLLKESSAWVLKNNPSYDKWNLQYAAYNLALEHYQYLYGLNNDLRAIADFFSHLRGNDNQFASESELLTSRGETITLPSFEVQLKREGTTGKVHKGLSDAVIGVDLDRIRTCEICNRIFWAKRTESSTCTPQHYETLKKRRSRALTDEEKAERKAKREANRELIKKGKAKSTKRNK